MHRLLLPAVSIAALALGPLLAEEPAEVRVQHILVGFKRSVPGKEIARTKPEARLLAEQLVERARAGEDFDALVREHTDDSAPGIHVLLNNTAPLRAGATPRRKMVPGFGDLAFRLAPGEVGLVAHHAERSPYGFHVIKRLE
jgi:parvulin-like peptidyl-prolyl isomerase